MVLCTVGYRYLQVYPTPGDGYGCPRPVYQNYADIKTTKKKDRGKISPTHFIHVASEVRDVYYGRGRVFSSPGTVISITCRLRFDKRRENIMTQSRPDPLQIYFCYVKGELIL